jgi:hypothetical protein
MSVLPAAAAPSRRGGGGTPAGDAVVLEIALTVDLRPTPVRKELYVAAGRRTNGVGAALPAGAAGLARARAGADAGPEAPPRAIGYKAVAESAAPRTDERLKSATIRPCELRPL